MFPLRRRMPKSVRATGAFHTFTYSPSRELHPHPLDFSQVCYCYYQTAQRPAPLGALGYWCGLTGESRTRGFHLRRVTLCPLSYGEMSGSFNCCRTRTG